MVARLSPILPFLLMNIQILVVMRGILEEVDIWAAEGEGEEEGAVVEAVVEDAVGIKKVPISQKLLSSIAQKKMNEYECLVVVVVVVFPVEFLFYLI